MYSRVFLIFSFVIIYFSIQEEEVFSFLEIGLSWERALIGEECISGTAAGPAVPGGLRGQSKI